MAEGLGEGTRVEGLGGETGMLLVLFVIIVAATLRMVKRLVNIPVVAVTVAWGFIAGMVVNRYEFKEQFLVITDFHINELLVLYMPVLVFTVTFCIRYHLFQDSFYQCCILGGVGLVLSCCMYVLYMTFMDISVTNSNTASILISFLICCPEPMFITDISFLTSAKCHILETLIMGEALIGICILWFVYHMFAAIETFTLYGCFWTLLTTLLIGPAFGKLVGHILAYALISLSQDISITYLVSICAVYVTYLVAEIFLSGAGITAIISLALTTSAHSASTIMDPGILRKFWTLFRYCFNVVIVFLASFKIGRDSTAYAGWDDVSTIVHSYLAKLIVRACMIVVLYPVLCSTGYQLSWKQCLVLFWVNFKSAVMMGISLSRWLTNINIDFALREEAVRLGVLFLVQVINSSTLPKLMDAFDLMQMSQAERVNMNMVVASLRNTAKSSTNVQRREKKFSGADWKWIETHTFIENPYSGATTSPKVRFPRIKVIRRRSEALLEEALQNANMNILRLQKVCYNKQYEDGMVHKKSKTTILAALQYPMEKETYLTVDLMMPYITVPPWIYALKDALQLFAGMDVVERRSSHRTSSRFDESSDTLFPDVDLWSACASQGWYHVLVGFVATGFVLLLSGLAIYYNHRMSDAVLSVVTTVQGIYVFLYALEILLVVYNMGTSKLGSDIWRQLDLIIFALIVAEFVLTSFVTVKIDDKTYALFLMYSFILLITCRTIKTLQKRAVLFVWLWDLMDGMLNRRLFYAYDLCWAYITAEDEAMAKASRFVPSMPIANKIRESCGRNKLQTLKNVIDIQQKYPNIEVATKTRQAARRILNKALDALHELHDGGLLDDKQFGILYEDLTWMIHKVDGMPSNIKVGNTSLCILLSIPWLPAEIVPNLLHTFYECQRRGHIVALSGHEHDRVSIICSGIVKVYGKGILMTCSLDGKLTNSDSNQYYFTEGSFKDYLVSPDTIGIVGFLTGEPSVCQAVCETDVEFCSIPMEVLERIVEHHPEPPTVIYRMWFSVAVRIGVAVLVNHKRYQDWTHDKLKRFLESGIMPNLHYAVEFSLDEAVQDVILIQGCVCSRDNQEAYYAPAYIPHSLREMKLPGRPSSRPRPIMLITTLMRYHLPAELDWYHQPLRPFDYVHRARSPDDTYAHW